MANGVRRLNRRRYRESVAALKEIIGDKKTPALRKLRAIDVLLGIYDRHDRSEAAKGTRRKAEDAPEPDGEPSASPDASGRAEASVHEAALRHLASIMQGKTQEISNDE